MFRGETWVWRGGRADLVWVPDTETMRWRGTFSGFYYIVLFTEEAKLTRRQRTSF